jgi:hypothetical protein
VQREDDNALAQRRP